MAGQYPKWSIDDLKSDCVTAKSNFVASRTSTGSGRYKQFYAEAVSALDALFQATDDLTALTQMAPSALSTGTMEILRYLVGPPISEDDLKSVAGVHSLARGTLVKEPRAWSAVIAALVQGLDSARFPWLASTGARPSAVERQLAVAVTASLMATQREQTARRGAGKLLEADVKAHLVSQGYVEASSRGAISSVLGSNMPSAGTFLGETSVAGARADVVIRLKDQRLALIECKDSNSTVNSYKRVFHECGSKLKSWQTFGNANIVPLVVIAGVHDARNLESAQALGLGIVWAHRLNDLNAVL